MIYFDNAATSGKKPVSVIKAVAYALENLSANPGRSGHELSIKTADAVYSARSKISNFFGADGPENVVFTQNCTHSINCVLKGVLKKGDHVIISNLEHNAVMRPLLKIGTDYSVAKVTENEDETVDNFSKLIKPNTRLIFVCGASNVLGDILPIKRLGELCKNKRILFGVDGAQIAGIMPINMQKMNIDYLCLAPHKSLYAPMGIGVLICRKPLINTILEGGTGTDSLDFLQPKILPEGMESGTINVPGIMGLSAGLDFVEKLGVDRIYKHEFELVSKLYSGLENNENFILYTNQPTFLKTAPVLPFNLKNCDSFKLGTALNQHGFAVRSGLHCAPTAHKVIGTLNGGVVRASFGVFNSLSEVERFLNLIKSDKFIKNVLNER
jgi:cysteine desulfurase family protein